MPAPIYISLLRAARNNRQWFYEETGFQNNESDDRIEAWLWTVFVDLNSGWSKTSARVGSSLASRSEIPGDVFSTLIENSLVQSLWKEGILFLQDGTILYDVRVVPGVGLSERTSTIVCEKRCYAELERLMANDSKPDRSKEEYRAKLRSELAISHRAFDRAWAQAIAHTGNLAWGKPGRKSRHRIDTPV